MKKLLTSISIVFAMSWSGQVLAEKVGTPEEAKSMAEVAEQFSKSKGVDALLKSIASNDPRFNSKGMHISVLDFKAKDVTDAGKGKLYHQTG